MADFDLFVIGRRYQRNVALRAMRAGRGLKVGLAEMGDLAGVPQVLHQAVPSAVTALSGVSSNSASSRKA